MLLSHPNRQRFPDSSGIFNLPGIIDRFSIYQTKIQVTWDIRLSIALGSRLIFNLPGARRFVFTWDSRLTFNLPGTLEDFNLPGTVDRFSIYGTLEDFNLPDNFNLPETVNDFDLPRTLR